MSDLLARFAPRLNRGFYPAVPVTLRADGSFDEAAHAAYVAWMAAQPVQGVAAWAHTGRGLMLSPEVQARAMRDWTGALGDKLVIAGVGAMPDPELSGAAAATRYRDDTLRMAELALSCGADALMMYAPVIYRGAPDQDARILQHVEALGSLGAPVVLFYLYEAAGGVSYSLDLLRAMFAVPQVVGIKMATLDSVMTYQDVSLLVKEEFPHHVLVTGEDRFLGYSLMAGATAALIGMGAACTAPQAALLQAWFEGQTTDFVQLNTFVDLFAQATFCAPMEGYIQRMLWVLADQGIIPEESAHDPFGPDLPAAEREVVRRRARMLESAI